MGGYGQRPGFAEMGGGRRECRLFQPRLAACAELLSGAGNRAPRAAPAPPPIIEGELVASSSGDAGGFEMGERVFHDKFGYGRITEIDGNKLTVDFEKAGRKRVVASFVTRP